MITHGTVDWALFSKRVVTPQGVRPAAVLVANDKIAALVELDDVPLGVPVENVEDKIVLPGLVDTHVHINEPGRTEWEGFETATRAAAAGGITTLIDMPLNSSPATTTVATLRAKRQAAGGKLWVDVGFHGGVVPGNADDVQPLIDAGVCAFKAFLCPSGIDEFPASTAEDLRRVMPILARAGLPLFVHAELMSALPTGIEERFAANPQSYQCWLAMRPPEWEVAAIRLMIELCRQTRCPVHIVHLSAACEALPLIAEAKGEGLPVSVETCPHYLNFAAEEIADGDTLVKCAPPIRSGAQRSRLRDGVFSGEIDTIGSDHSPAPANLKHIQSGDLRQAWGGIASLQFLLPAAWQASGLPALDALTRRPANLVGIARNKGALAAGRDADLVVFDAETEYEITPEIIQFRHTISPFVGKTFRGVVETTYLRGRKVYEHGKFPDGPTGQLLERSRE